MIALLVVYIAVGVAVFVWWLWREEPGPWIDPMADRRRRAAVGESVLFVCTHNAARSQMAEALLRDLAGVRFHVASAGTSPTSVHPLTTAVMMERGLDLSMYGAKRLADVGTSWDYVITLCDAAYEQCSEFPAKTARLHWSIEDPALASGSPSAQLAVFRRVREDLRTRITRWLADRPERL
jgi:arsenate reductase